MKNLILLSLFLLIIFSCEKEQVEPVPELCMNDLTVAIDNLDMYLSCSSYNFVNNSNYLFKDPMFHPTNPNEIFFLKKEINTDNWAIWIFDLCNGLHKKAFDKNVEIYDLSIQNWLLFIDTNNDIWKTKPDGSEMEKILTTNFTPEYIQWSPDGSKFILTTSSLVQAATNIIIYDIDGNEINELDNLQGARFQKFDWYQNKIYYGNTYSEVRSFDLETEESELLYELIGSTESLENNVKVINDNLYFSTQYELYKLDLENNNIALLEYYYEMNLIQDIDVSLNESTILCTKIEYFETPNCDIETVEKLMLADIDGENSRNILIP